MDWGNIQVESLKKMFLNNDDLVVSNLSTYKTDKKYKTYLFAMPQACNEAVDYICSVLNSNEVLETLTKTNESDYYNLSDVFDDYKDLKDLICDKGISWRKINKNIIYIENWIEGEVKVLYEVQPTKITSTTISTKTIEIPNQYSRLIPLYIAGELYKDDDLTQATMYMNEFMTLINAYVNNSSDFTNPKIESIYSI